MADGERHDTTTEEMDPEVPSRAPAASFRKGPAPGSRAATTASAPADAGAAGEPGPQLAAPVRKSTMTVAVFNPSTGWRLPDQYVQALGQVSADVTARAVGDRAALLTALPTTDFLVGFPLTDEEFAKFGANLKWIQLTAASSDTILAMPSVIGSTARITTAAGFQASQRAEHAIMLILALLRRLSDAFAAQIEHTWMAHELSTAVDDLAGKTVGVIGFGSVGRAIAQRLRPFGVETLATLGDPGDPFVGVNELMPLNRLDELLSRSDVVIVSVPLSPVADGLLNRAMLSNMKKSAIIINVSRSQAIREDALIDALTRGRIAGAGLDSFEKAPLPENSPLWRMSNVIVTPRLGGVSPHYWSRAVQMISQNLTRLLAGQPMLDELERDGAA